MRLPGGEPSAACPGNTISRDSCFWRVHLAALPMRTMRTRAAQLCTPGRDGLRRSCVRARQANILTGLINLTASPGHASAWQARTVLLAYIAILYAPSPFGDRFCMTAEVHDLYGCPRRPGTTAASVASKPCDLGSADRRSRVCELPGTASNESAASADRERHLT